MIASLIFQPCFFRYITPHAPFRRVGHLGWRESAPMSQRSTPRARAYLMSSTCATLPMLHSAAGTRFCLYKAIRVSPELVSVAQHQCRPSDILQRVYRYIHHVRQPDAPSTGLNSRSYRVCMLSCPRSHHGVM